MAGRKDNGDGSITKRADGRWEARATLPDGKRKSFYGKTKDEVKKKLEQVKRDIHDGMPVIMGQQTVQQFLETWIITKKPYLRYSTWRTYNGFLRNHIIPSLGRTFLQKLTVQQAQLFYAQLFEEGLSATTVHLIHKMLKSALQEAFRLGILQRNPLGLVKAPRRSHHEMITLTEGQVNQFLAAVSGDWFEALYVLAVTTGMREGELLGLRWKDIDFDNGAVMVLMAVKQDEVGLVLSETKTDHSRRRIALTRLALDALRRHRILQDARRLLLGSLWDDSLDLVFPNTIGRIMNPKNLRSERHFKHHLQRVGLQDMRFHDLRHTCATLLLSRGVNIKVVSEMLGHADVSITLQVYGHVLPHMQQMAVQQMDAIFSDDGKLSSKLSSNDTK